MDLATYARETGATPTEFREKLAQHGLEVSREIVRRWLLGEQPPGIKSVRAIELATDGKVTKNHLRPDIFGAPVDPPTPTQGESPAEVA